MDVLPIGAAADINATDVVAYHRQAGGWVDFRGVIVIAVGPFVCITGGVRLSCHTCLSYRVAVPCPADRRDMGLVFFRQHDGDDRFAFIAGADAQLQCYLLDCTAGLF